MQEGATPAKARSLREQVFACSLSFSCSEREQTVKLLSKPGKPLRFPGRCGKIKGRRGIAPQ